MFWSTSEDFLQKVCSTSRFVRNSEKAKNVHVNASEMKFPCAEFLSFEIACRLFFQKRPQKEFEICFPRHFRVGGFTRQRGQKRLIGITATFSFHPSIIFTHGDEKTFFKRFFKVKNVLFSYLESLVLLCNWPSIFAAPKKYRTHSSHPSWGGKRNFHLPFSVKKRDRSFFSWLTPISTWKVQVGVFFAAFSSLTGYE